MVLFVFRSNPNLFLQKRERKREKENSHLKIIHLSLFALRPPPFHRTPQLRQSISNLYTPAAARAKKEAKGGAAPSPSKSAGNPEPNENNFFDHNLSNYWIILAGDNTTGHRHRTPSNNWVNFPGEKSIGSWPEKNLTLFSLFGVSTRR